MQFVQHYRCMYHAVILQYLPCHGCSCNSRNLWLSLASFPGPAQLSVTCSTESWAGPGNEATCLSSYLSIGILWMAAAVQRQCLPQSLCNRVVVLNACTLVVYTVTWTCMSFYSILNSFNAVFLFQLQKVDNKGKYNSLNCNYYIQPIFIPYNYLISQLAQN